jgi:hypothetical protein
MSTDRELLELAAKAAGIDFRYVHNTAGGQFLWDGEKLVEWNPLTDDGDALRLAVKLDIELQRFKTIFIVKWGKAGNPYEWLSELLNPDPYAAARRAIVRAAAAIGRN